MGISLRILLTVMILIMTLAAALIAFFPTYISGRDAVASTIADIRSSYANRAESSIQSYLQVPLIQLEQNYNFFRSSLQIAAFPNKTAIIRYLVDLAVSNKETFSTANIFIGPPHTSDGNPIYIYVDSDLDPTTPHLGVLSPPDPTTQVSNLEATGINVNDLSLIYNTLYTRNITLSYPGFEDNWLNLGSQNPEVAALSAPRVGYVGVQAALQSPTLSAIVQLVDPGDTAIGYAQINSKLDQITNLIQDLGLRQRSAAIAYLLYPDMRILGFSWDEQPFQLNANFLDFSLPEWERIYSKWFNNMTTEKSGAASYVLDEVVPTLGMDRLQSSSYPYSTEIKTKEHGLTYIDIVGVERPGLKMRVLLVMPEVDFMEGIIKSRTAALAGTFSAIAVTVVLAFICAHLITAPLVRLQERMELAARFQDDGSNDDPKSFMSEVALMQTGYEGMRNELNKAKPYLPQSVLQQNNTDEDDEEDVPFNPAESTIVGSSPVGSKGQAPGQSVEGSSMGRSSDSRSVRSSRSGASSYRLRAAALGGGAGGGLNTANSATAKRISLLVFNLSKFHEKCAAPSQLLSIQKKQLTSVSKYVKENRGVIDFFQGDHIQCSFNAVNNCGAHTRRAITAALGVVSELRQDALCPGVSVGMASGMAVVGNMGNEEMRRFCIVGHIVQQANMLERLNKKYGTTILTNAGAVSDIWTEFVFRTVGFNHLPRPRTSAPVILCECLGAASKGEADEWMYELEKGEDSNPFNKLNSVFDFLLDGEVQKAEEKVSELNLSDTPSASITPTSEEGPTKPTKLQRKFSQVGLASAERLDLGYKTSLTAVKDLIDALKTNPDGSLAPPIGFYEETLLDTHHQ